MVLKLYSKEKALHYYSIYGVAGAILIKIIFWVCKYSQQSSGWKFAIENAEILV
jgi:hypothetical protein